MNWLLHGEIGPLLMLSIILLAGIAGGAFARWMHVPTITGNMIAGLIIGPAGLGLFGGANISEALMPLSTFAMGLIAVLVGSQLSYRRIHNALRRIVKISLLEALGAVAAVTLLTRALGAPWTTAFVLGSISAATAPATTLAVVRETRSTGSFVKTLLSVVALDNMLCIMLFAFSSVLLVDVYADGVERSGIVYALVHTIWQFCGSFIMGMLLGYITERLILRAHLHDFSIVFLAVLLSVGISDYLDLSPLLTCLFLGIYIANAPEEASRQTNALAPLEPLLFVSFFTVAGASLHLDTLADAGLLCAAYVVARVAGKVIGASLGGLLASTSRRIWQNIGLGLMPQAGVAIGLVVLLGGNPDVPRGVAELVNTLVLGAVTINEIIGPFITRFALRRAKEVNKDRRRLIEFLEEEYILHGLVAEDKWEALRKLTDFYILTHRVPQEAREGLYNSIIRREQEHTTAIGRGAAIPHGRIPRRGDGGIRGAMAICAKPVDFDAPDGEPVQLLMLVVTPQGHETEHLEVMASLAQMISDDAIRSRLLASINANDAWEIIESEETRNYNYFLSETTGGGNGKDTL